MVPMVIFVKKKKKKEKKRKEFILVLKLQVVQMTVPIAMRRSCWWSCVSLILVVKMFFLPFSV